MVSHPLPTYSCLSFEMAGSSYSIFKTLLLLFGLFHLGRPQTQATIGQNFCLNNATSPSDDNLSCRNSPIEGVACIPRTDLCDGEDDCMDGGIGSDEGDPNFFNPLECKSDITSAKIVTDAAVLIFYSSSNQNI